jgi:hypothetical protein
VNFYFEIKSESEGMIPGMGEGNPVFTFDSTEGKHMSDMLTDYALALLREMGLNPDGSKRVRKTPVAAASSMGPAPAPEAVSAPALPPEPASAGKAAMAVSEDAYKAVSGDVGLLASAALRSGAEGNDDAPPPPPEGEDDAPPPPAAEAGDDVLPENWIKVLDESSGDHYFFNTVTGDSVWERSEIPQ